MKKWKVVGASVQGASHRKMANTPCQDAHAHEVLGDGTLVVAVADGAGSAKYSQEGSAAAVDAIISFVSLLGSIPATGVGIMRLLFDTFEQARLALEGLAEEMSVRLRDLHTTLWVVVAAGDVVAIARLGDGFAVAELEDGSLVSLMHQQKGEYAGETFFLTDPGALERVQVMVYHARPRSLSVSTDGLVRLAMEVASWEPFAGFFRPLVDFTASVEDEAAGCKQLAEFLDSARINTRTDDDKTLVIAVRKEVKDETR